MEDVLSKPTKLTQGYSKTGSRSSIQDFLLWFSLLSDLILVFLGLCLGYWIRFRSGWITMGNEPADLVFGDYIYLVSLGSLFLVLTFAYLGLYEPRKALIFRQVFPIILKGSTFWVVAYLGLSLTLRFEPSISRIYVASSYACCFLTLLLWRYALSSIVKREVFAKGLRQRVLIVGWNEKADQLANAIESSSFHPYEIVGVISPPGGTFHSEPPPGTNRLGDYLDIEQKVRDRFADIVVVADLDSTVNEITSLANLCEKEYVQFKVIPTYFQILVSGLQLETISSVPILGVTQLPLDHLANRIVKRTIDIIGSFIGLVLSIPIIAICGICVYLESPGPIFYRQIRTGRNGRNFKIIKIRSMKLDAEAEKGAQWATEEDNRRLKIGAFMREWNLDEVPQFWNVLKGEMSLVGPRPERPELIEGFKEDIPHYNARHASKPGITGWAQVNGLRGNTSLSERIRYDLYYLENWNIWLDFQIIALTFIKRENAY